MCQVGDRIRIEPFDEEGEVYKFEDHGSHVAIGVIFHPSKRAETLILSREEFARRVTPVPALWQDFVARALPRDAFLLFTDALRMRLAHAFDPHYAVSVTQVDLLSHQVDAVYRHILPMLWVRFLLADDPNLGRTIMAGLVLRGMKGAQDGMLRPAHCARPLARPVAAGDERLVPFGWQRRVAFTPAVEGVAVEVLAALGAGGGVSVAEERFWVGQEAVRGF